MKEFNEIDNESMMNTNIYWNNKNDKNEELKENGSKKNLNEKRFVKSFKIKKTNYFLRKDNEKKNQKNGKKIIKLMNTSIRKLKKNGLNQNLQSLNARKKNLKSFESFINQSHQMTYFNMQRNTKS